MTQPLLFDEDKAQRLRQIFTADDPEKAFTIVTQQDVGPVLAENQAQRNDAPKHTLHDKSGLTKVASIPNVVMMQLREQGILEDPKRFKAWLNDPENQVFRTRGGKV